MAKAIVGLIDQPKLNEIGREMQAPQAINDHHDAGYDNDVPMDWRRKDACAKPGFDYTSKRLAGGRHRDTP